MATSAGPNLISDGLVFGYDTGYPAADNTQSLRFNKGEPTTNLITNPIPQTDTTGFNRSGGTGTISYDSTEKALKWVQTDYESWGTYLNIHPSFTGTLSTSTQYTFSFEYKTLNTFGDNLISHQLVQGNGQSAAASTGAISNNTSGEINGWKQFSVTFTPGNTGVSSAYNRLVTGDRGSDTLTIYIRNIQFEQKSHQTPFVDGTRSSTGALIDLAKHKYINVSNITFDSTGQPEFDGTDDYVDIGTDIEIADTNEGWTAEYVFNTDSASTLQHFNGCEEDVHNAGWLALYESKLQVWNRDPGTWKKGSTVFASNTWYHVAFVQESGTSMQFYVNGVAEGGDHTSYSWNANKSAFFARYIGRYEYNGSYSRYWNGHIAVARLYSKPFTAAEIKQNYNSLKQRFGI
jgi:hypothetical protein